MERFFNFIFSLVIAGCRNNGVLTTILLSAVSLNLFIRPNKDVHICVCVL